MKKVLVIVLAAALLLGTLPFSVLGANVNYGDVNTDKAINAKDLLMLKQHLASYTVNIDLAAADCNGDNAINAKDLLRLKQWLADWDVVLGPAEGTTAQPSTGTTTAPDPSETTAEFTHPLTDALGGGGEVTEQPDIEDISGIVTDIGGVDYSDTNTDLRITGDPDLATTTIKLADSGCTITGGGATAAGGVVSITEAGNYVFSGTLSDGQIYVNVDANVYIILNGVSITCKKSAPIVLMGKKKKVVTLAAGTENTLTDSDSYSVFYNTDNDEPNGALFSKKALTINGKGKLTVNAKYNNGISCKDVLKIVNADITVNAVNNAIKGNDAVLLKSCKLNIASQSTGIKSDSTDVGLGFIYANGASATIKSEEDALSAVSHLYIVGGTYNIKSGTNGAQSSYPKSDTASRKGIKCESYLLVDSGTLVFDCYDDAIHCNDSVIIRGGNISITTKDDAIHADEVVEISGGTVDIISSYEGIEAVKIKISGGDVSMVSSDDGINASDGTGTDFGPNLGGGDTSEIYFVMTGGTLYINAQGDGLDSNGTITITDGTITVDGPTGNGNGALDSNNGLLMNGGRLIAVGSLGMVETPGSNSKQNCVSIAASKSLAANTELKLCDSTGAVIYEHKTAKTCQSIVISCAELKLNESYTFYVNGTSTYTFTQTSVVTKVPTGSGGGGWRPR